ncbi:hypothetical protein LO763_19590 [Glycomyces sp. A-F 0318]|uniref:hypothetical protein n=1 Tax=Glycomyces amatae TaxID=2881355 RepID=UPI001E5004DE|nr:hypothetical protein [Glycomyces amatae]MCD0445815.1 hypothetical protein [Glycomyces amatae]
MTEHALSLQDLPPIRQGGVGKTEAILRGTTFQHHRDEAPQHSTIRSDRVKPLLRVGGSAAYLSEVYQTIIVDTPPHTMDDVRADMNTSVLHEVHQNGNAA